MAIRKPHIAPDITLVVTTYNKPDYLEVVLRSILRQKLLPTEVIIADDGSTEETRELIDRYRLRFPVPLIHSWIPDEGFRLAKSRNMAIHRAKGDYIIFIDGDIAISRSFVRDHQLLREPGTFVNGGRARLTRAATERRMHTHDPRFSAFTPGLLRPLTLIRLPWWHYIAKGENGRRKIRGCNMAFWKSDLYAVNGFEENIVGWGSEDTELVARLFNLGIQRKNAKGMATCVHLWHPHPDNQTNTRTRNREFTYAVVREGRTRALLGLDQYATEE